MKKIRAFLILVLMVAAPLGATPVLFNLLQITRNVSGIHDLDLNLLLDVVR